MYAELGQPDALVCCLRRFFPVALTLCEHGTADASADRPGARWHLPFAKATTKLFEPGPVAGRGWLREYLEGQASGNHFVFTIRESKNDCPGGIWAKWTYKLLQRPSPTHARTPARTAAATTTTNQIQTNTNRNEPNPKPTNRSPQRRPRSEGLKVSWLHGKWLCPCLQQLQRVGIAIIGVFFSSFFLVRHTWHWLDIGVVFPMRRQGPDRYAWT